MKHYNREIAPTKKYRIVVVDGAGNYLYTIKYQLSDSPIYYETRKDAKEAVEYYENEEPWRYGLNKGNKLEIIEASFDDEISPGYYQKPHGGRRYKFSPEERKRIREEQEESDSYGPPYKWFPPLPDEEIEPLYRKKKTAGSKTKRPFGKKAGSKLQSFYGIKTDIGGKAGNMLQSIYRVKTATRAKPKRKVTKRKSK